MRENRGTSLRFVNKPPFTVREAVRKGPDLRLGSIGDFRIHRAEKLGDDFMCVARVARCELLDRR